MPTHHEMAARGSQLEALLYRLFLVAAGINLGANFILGLRFQLGLETIPSSQFKLILDWVIGLSKSALVPTLAGSFALSAPNVTLGIRRGAILAALLCCWVGDVALLSKERFFLGMAAFAIAHLCFIAAYSKGVDLGAAIKDGSWTYTFPIGMYGYMIYMTVYANIDDEKTDGHMVATRIAIAVYMTVLLLNGMMCLIRRLQDRQSTPNHLVTGIVLFIQSDSLIAMTVYVDTLPFEDLAIMLTYIVGLCWMVRSCRADRTATAPRSDPRAEPLSIPA